MTFEKLQQLIEKYNVPKDVKLLSNSGWECGETEMNGLYFNRSKNELVFTQSADEFESYDTRYKGSRKEHGYIELKLKEVKE